MKCVKTYFSRKILCAGAMSDFIKIQNRELTAGGYDSEPQEIFTNVLNMNGNIEEVKPTDRFNGVNVADGITHIVYVPFEQSIYELDINTLFVELERSKNRRFKMLSVGNLGEQDQYMALYCKETGFVDKEATAG